MSSVLAATEGPKTLDFWLVTGVAPLPDSQEKRKKRIDEPATPRIGGCVELTGHGVWRGEQAVASLSKQRF